MLLTTLAITTTTHSPASHRGALAGADRVLLLSGLARAANVQQLAVSIAGIQSGPGSVQSITFKVRGGHLREQGA